MLTRLKKFRRAGLSVGVGVAVLVVGAVTYISTDAGEKMYSSHSLVYAPSSSTIPQPPAVLSFLPEPLQIADYQTIAKSPGVLVEAQKKTGSSVTIRDLKDRVTIGAGDPKSSNLLTVTASGSSPAIAQLECAAMTAALTQFDASRIAPGLRQVLAGIEAEVSGLDLEISREGSGGDLTSLTTERESELGQMSDLQTVLESGTGYLSVLQAATFSPTVVSPTPRRDAVLVGLAALVLSGGFAIYRDSVVRSNRSTPTESLS